MTKNSRGGAQISARICPRSNVILYSLAREAIYRIAQEALSNVVRHAHAKSVSVTLGTDGKLVTLEIADDGVGFDAGDEPPEHLGQQSMRERATALGGTLDVTSQPRSGTTVRAAIPCEADLAASSAF